MASATPPQLARRAEQAGAAMITVHGRTRRQFYDGRADWRAVGEVVAEVGVPVVVNGDCRSLEDARAMLAASGARAVMIGRAAIGAPWIVGAIARALQSGAALEQPPLDERRDAALSHLDSLLLAAMGRRAGLRHARKHLAAYAEKAGAAPAIRVGAGDERGPGRRHGTSGARVRNRRGQGGGMSRLDRSQPAARRRGPIRCSS